jgi:hypothetical protein
MVVLKPQDVLVVLKLCAYESDRPPLANVAVDLGMSSSEVHAALRRAHAAHLLTKAGRSERPNPGAVLEFLVHGLKYVFPVQRGEVTRGIPTSYGAEPLKHLIAPGAEPIPVWPHAEGTARGAAIEPLYRTAPFAALRDRRLHELLALADAMREGRARERKIAEQQLRIRLRTKKKYAES